MISIKAATALGLTGLGASTLTVDAYLLSKSAKAPISAGADAEPVPASVQVRHAVIPDNSSTSVDDSTLVLEPIVIRSRTATHHEAAPPERQLVPCSDWRELATGPSGRHVRQLCVAGSSSEH